MIKTFLFILIFLLFISVAALLIIPLNGKVVDAEEDYKETRSIVLRNGAVVNIWLNSEDRLDVLREHEIKYLFVDVGDTLQDGSLGTSDEEIINFLNKVEFYEKETGHNFILLPYSEVNTYTYDISSDLFQDNFVQDYVRLDSLGFDGVYVDIEPIRTHQIEEYFDLLGILKRDLPSSSILGVYSGALGSESEWDWDAGFFQTVDKRVDLIFVPGYDTGIDSKEEYQEHIKSQLRGLSDLNLRSVLLLGVPTHKSDPENIENALEAYSLEINEFDGVAIFSEWTADETEWNVLKDYL
jgi:hypothetical protein